VIVRAGIGGGVCFGFCYAFLAFVARFLLCHRRQHENEHESEKQKKIIDSKMGKLASGIPDTLVSQVSGLRIKYK